MSREEDLAAPGPVGRAAATIYWASILGAVPGSALEAYKRAHGRYFLPTWREIANAYGPFEPVMAELLASMEENWEAIKAKLPPFTPDVELLKLLVERRRLLGRPADDLERLIAKTEGSG